MTYEEFLREKIIALHNWPAGGSAARENRRIRILLVTREWVTGGLKTNDEATITIQLENNGQGDYKDLVIPYHAICAVEQDVDSDR